MHRRQTQTHWQPGVKTPPAMFFLFASRALHFLFSQRHLRRFTLSGEGASPSAPLRVFPVARGNNMSGCNPASGGAERKNLEKMNNRKWLLGKNRGVAHSRMWRDPALQSGSRHSSWTVGYWVQAEAQTGATGFRPGVLGVWGTGIPLQPQQMVSTA